MSAAPGPRLLIDLGNSKCRFAWTETDRLKPGWTIATGELASAVLPPELAAALPGREGWLASVVKPQNPVLAARLAAAGLARLRTVQAGEIMPHRLLTPQTTGVDRLLAARAARDLFAADRGALIVQAGTALTVDLVNPAGEFLGGWILPGPDLWLAGLNQAAALPALTAGEAWQPAADTPPGRDTESALRGGLAVGLLGAARAAAAALRRQLPADAPTIVTGGWGQFLAGQLEPPGRWEADLVLEGLRLVSRADDR